MTTVTADQVQLHELSVRYCFACKNYGSSSLSMFKDDIMALVPQLIRLGVSPEMLNEIYDEHVG